MTSLAERQRAKAAELGVSVRTIEGKRVRYAAQGLWGLVDQRVTRTFDIAGQADPRLVEVVEQMLDAETGQSTGTRSRLIRRVTARVEELHGPGVVPLPGRTAFYALIDRLSVGRHTFGSAVTRRQLANRPDGVFTPTFAMRPGEQIQIDSTPIDVMVLAEDGVPVRADLTIAVDVATRSICAAVLRPVGTKAVDASLVLAKMLVPEPMRPGWPSTLRMSVSRLPYERLVRYRRAHAGSGRAAGDSPGPGRHRPRQGVRLRHLRARLRPAGHLRPARPQGHPDRQGRGRGHLHRDQDVVRAALRDPQRH